MYFFNYITICGKTHEHMALICRYFSYLFRILYLHSVKGLSPAGLVLIYDKERLVPLPEFLHIGMHERTCAKSDQLLILIRLKYLIPMK